MKNATFAVLVVFWSARAFAQDMPSCSEWQKGDRTAAACSCAGVVRAGADRALACGAGPDAKAAPAAAPFVDGAAAAGARVASLESSSMNFDGASALPDAPTPQPAAAPVAAPGLRPKFSLQKPLDRRIGNDSYLASSLAFHAAGAFDVISTDVGIKRDPNFHEADPVYLAIFGQRNDRNTALITTVAIVTHLGAQGISWYLHREANKQGEAGHRVRQYLLDTAVAAGNGVGAALHVKEGRTWYGSEGGPL